MADTKVDNKRKLSWVLSLAGFLPMIGLAGSIYLLGSDHVLSPSLTQLFKTWSIIVLSFLGGIRWGMAMTNSEESPWVLFGTIVPCAIGWMTLFMDEPLSFLILLVAYSAQGAWDSLSINSGAAPKWFGRIRIWLTLLVVSAHLLAILSYY